MKILLYLIISGALIVSGYPQTRNVLVGTNNAVVQPTNFWSADASNARSGLGLGTAATNPASAFQPSSTVLSNLASSNAANLTNVRATNIVGSSFSLTSSVLSNLALNNGGALTNIQATNLVGVIPSSNIATVNFSNVAGTLSVASGGTGATNAANARQNLGSTTVGDALFIATNAAAARTTLGATTVGSSVFTLANPSAITFLRLNADNTASALSAGDFRTALSLGTAATNPATAFQPASSALTNLSTNNAGSLTNLIAANITGTIAISNGGSGATTVGGARTNLGLPLAALTNTTVASFRSALNLDTTNDVVFRSLAVTNATNNTVARFEGVNGNVLEILTTDEAFSAGYPANLGSIGVDSEGFSIKYGTDGGDWGYPVVVDASGAVVRPTNFWQVAPITTTFIESQPTTNFTTNITPARFLHIHSLSTNIVNVTNTIVLPTNTLTFEGDVAIVVHKGPTNSMTRVQRVGSTNNLITLTRFDEAVQFVYYNNVWQFDHNVAFVEPIYFSGTNATANAAASRTNLGLGATNEVWFATVSLGKIFVTEFGEIEFEDEPTAAGFRTNLGLGATWLTNTNVTNFRSAIGLGETNEVAFDVVNTVSGLRVFSGTNLVVYIGEDIAEFETQLYVGNELGVSFSTNNSGAATTRTNLGLPLPALTNTNNANFQAAIFNTNSVPTNSANVNAVNFNTAIHWMEVNVVTNGVTNNFRIPLFK